MATNQLLQSIQMRGFLSYGPDAEPVDLRPLNVLIGPNGSGKTNLIEALLLLRSTPTNLPALIRDGGGVTEWLWKGQQGANVAEIEAIVNYPGGKPLRHRFSFTVSGQRLELLDEAIEETEKRWIHEQDVYFFYRYQHGNPVLNTRAVQEPVWSGGAQKRYLRREDLSVDQSVLAQRKDPDLYPEITYLAKQYSRIRSYSEWTLGRYNVPRLPQGTDLPTDFLEENASNLGLVLNDLEYRTGAKNTVLEKLRKFYDGIEDISIRIQGGTVQIFLREHGFRPIPATRLSDGTLRYLALLAVLCHPEPPPLVCLEEPEIGIHPDIFPTIAELLIEASERTQLVVTTHSDGLVSALSETAGSVLVCGRDEQGSHVHRVDLEKLKPLLERHTLGELWRQGEIGGTRW